MSSAMLHDDSIETFLTDDSPDSSKRNETVADRRAMRRMGKKQVFNRKFRFPSIFGLALILMSSWESLLGVIAFGLGNGGPSGLLYSYMVSFICFTAIVASMAEMASMAPTSGGQYHWVSEFAPPSIQKRLSYLTGWLSILGYQIGVTITAFAPGLVIQGLIILNYSDIYVPEKWHATLMAVCITLCVALLNIFFAGRLPLIEGIITVLHVGGWIAIVVVLWVLGPRTPHDNVWNSFNDEGWGNTGVACMVGLVTSASALVGGDAAAHMSEELRNAPKILPQAMIWSVVTNGAMGLILLITVLYTMGDITSALQSPTGFPMIEIFRIAIGSKIGATAMMTMTIVLTIAAHHAIMACASRQLFAFARDKGVPYHRWISHTSPRSDVPVNAVLVTSVAACLLYCINLVSSIAFNIIASVGLVAFTSSYLASIACFTWRRMQQLPLPETEFSMGRWGLPVNVLSLTFLSILFVMLFFPPYPSPSSLTMNWACVVYGAVLLLACCHYLVSGRKQYVGPVEYVRKDA